MTGFVFKIHANMDPKHRDRLAFIKVVSGTLRETSPITIRQKKELSCPCFFAEKKEIVDSLIQEIQDI
jgi:peptide chain release factor 3